MSLTARHYPHHLLLPAPEHRSLVPSISRNIYPIRLLFLTQNNHFCLEILEIGYIQTFDSDSGNNDFTYNSYMANHSSSKLGNSQLEESLFDAFIEPSIRLSLDMHCDHFDPIIKVIYSYGLLEHILSYNSVVDVLGACNVNRRWNQAARTDGIWKAACNLLWKDKVGCPVLRRGKTLALFWRTMLLPHMVDRLSVKEIRDFFLEMPTGRSDIHEKLSNFLEKGEMRKAVNEIMPQRLGGGDCDGGNEKILTQGFGDIWFGSFASSIIDSRRSKITIDELCSRQGFDMHFKVAFEDHNFIHTPRTSDVRAGMKLNFHSTCYFDENYEFQIKTVRESEIEQPGLCWKWKLEGRTVQVGSYQPLVVSRLGNWSFKLENHQIVLYTHA